MRQVARSTAGESPRRAGGADRRKWLRSRRGVAGLVLLLLGAVLLGLFGLTAADEPHSYVGEASAPPYVHLSAAKKYSIGINGGVKEMHRLGTDPAVLSCTIRYPSTSSQPLAISADPVDTKATSQIATFIAPSSGRAHVACRSLPPVFIDNADDAGLDTADLFLVLACVTLAIGAPLVMSAVRVPAQYPTDAAGRSEPSA